MKNALKLFRIIALVAIIGFSFATCNKGGSSGSANAQSGGKVQSNPESDFKAEPIDGGKSVRITDYVGDKWEVGIPSKIRDLPITHIGVIAFRSKNLTKVTIPNSVTTIMESAFARNQLTSVTIPNSVTTIEWGAFASNQLTSITIGNSVTTIGREAFVGNQLTSVTIGANVSVDNDAFHEKDYVSSGFVETYNNSGKAAGTYTRINTDSTTWTKQ
jgi:hypothetical protein